jgi:ATP-binding cassette subfamily F protein 3
MLRKDNVLLLDEPTNHLDMDSREVLDDALEDFTGTILTVSHDRYFINRVANKVIEMNADGVVEFAGNYDNYLEKKRLMDAGEEEAGPARTKTEIEKDKRRQRLMRESKKALKQRVAALEGDIAATEELIEELESKMGDPATYQDEKKAAQVAHDHKAAQEKLEALYEEWTEAASVLESAE